MNIEIPCKNCIIYPESPTSFRVSLIEVEEEDIIMVTTEIPLEKIVSEIGHNDLLDAIGKDKCMEYFNLFEEE